MIGYYGSTDRKILQQIEKNIQLMESQLITMVELQRELLATLLVVSKTEKKILDVLVHPVRPAVALRFGFGHVVNK